MHFFSPHPLPKPPQKLTQYFIPRQCECGVKIFTDKELLHLQVEKQTSEKQSIKSSKAKKTAGRPRSKKNDEENFESNIETHDEKSAKITVTEIQGKYFQFLIII